MMIKDVTAMREVLYFCFLRQSWSIRGQGQQLLELYFGLMG
jgi:hypothetical protein